MVMRYLDTDTLLCWAPPPSGVESSLYSSSSTDSNPSNRNQSLREIQISTATPIISHLTGYIWPGVEIHGCNDPDSIVPTSQPQTTKSVIRGWVSGLPAFELVGLERAVLACKGLLAAARFVVEWSPEYRWVQEERDEEERERFGVEEAAKASSLEVDWQIGMWGEVEDSHDVDKEDLRRQLGSVVILLSGQPRADS
jgi:ATP synthase F1 complex assembly factor 2